MLITDNLTYADLFKLLADPEKELGRSIHPTFYSAIDWARKKKANNNFVTQVIKQPKIFLIGSEDDLNNLLERVPMSNSKTSNLYHVLSEVQYLLADTAYIALILDEEFNSHITRQQGILLTIATDSRLKKVKNSVMFLLFGICIETVCQSLGKSNEINKFLTETEFALKKEVLKIYYIYNVYKHSQGIIDDTQFSGKKLINEYSMTHGESLDNFISIENMINYTGNLYRGLESLIRLNGNISKSLIITSKDNKDICRYLLRKANYIKNTA